MKTGYLYTLLIFASGLIFGLGLNAPFTKEAIKTAYEYGRESVILKAVDGEIYEQFSMAEAGR